MANKYVKNAREGAKGTDRTTKHKRTQGRKIQEDGDKTKEKHGMKPHPHPTRNKHTLSLQGMTTRSYTRYDKYVTEKKKHKGAVHALCIGETQGKEVCYRRRYGKKT